MAEPDGAWKRTLALMVCVQVTMSAQNSSAVPFIPQFLRVLGVHPLSAVEFWAGSIIAAGALSSAVFSPIWGGIGDRIGRKKMVIRSSVATSVAMMLTGLCTSPWEMLGLRGVAGAFSGFSTAAMALVATQVPENRLGYALGWLSTGQLTGSLIGPLLGGLLADHLHDYRAVFYTVGIGTIVLSMTCVAFVHEERGTSELAESRTMSLFERMRSVALNRDLAPMFVVIMLAQICSIGIQPIVPIFVGSLLGDVPFKTTITGAAIAVTGIAGLLSSPFLGRRSDQIGYRRVLLISLTGAACFTLPQSLAANIWTFVGLRFGVGVFLGGILPSANAIIGRTARPETRGQVYGITAMAQFLGRFIGPLLGAGIAAAFGIPAVFACIGTLMLANLLWVSTQVRPPADVVG